MNNLKSLENIKDQYYGAVGTPKRDELERELESLRIGLKIREARERLNMTQEQLANRIDKKRLIRNGHLYLRWKVMVKI